MVRWNLLKNFIMSCAENTVRSTVYVLPIPPWRNVFSFHMEMMNSFPAVI